MSSKSDTNEQEGGRMQQPPRRYQRNGQPGKGLTITLAPALRARIEAAAATQHVSLAAVIVEILKRHFGISTETDEERAA